MTHRELNGIAIVATAIGALGFLAAIAVIVQGRYEFGGEVTAFAIVSFVGAIIARSSAKVAKAKADARQAERDDPPAQPPA